MRNADFQCFGKRQSLQDSPWLYLYGKIADQGEDLFIFCDRGTIWQKLDNILLSSTFLTLVLWDGQGNALPRS